MGWRAGVRGRYWRHAARGDLRALRGTAAEPAGEPPQTDPHATSVAVSVETSDGSPFEVGDPDLMHGAVLYSVVEGRGRLAGATGLITSNFLLRPAAGEFEERWVAVLFPG
jgi:hypothetical protein